MGQGFVREAVTEAYSVSVYIFPSESLFSTVQEISSLPVYVFSPMRSVSCLTYKKGLPKNVPDKVFSHDVFSSSFKIKPMLAILFWAFLENLSQNRMSGHTLSMNGTTFTSDKSLFKGAIWQKASSFSFCVAAVYFSESSSMPFIFGSRYAKIYAIEKAKTAMPAKMQAAPDTAKPQQANIMPAARAAPAHTARDMSQPRSTFFLCAALFMPFIFSHTFLYFLTCALFPSMSVPTLAARAEKYSSVRVWSSFCMLS